MSSQTSSSSNTPCPACGEPGSGRFCSACGASRTGSTCAACGSAIAAGAKFCHRCGTPAGAAKGAAARVVAPGGVGAGAAAARGGTSSALPWGVAFVALLGVAAMAAAGNFGKAKGSSLDAPLNALPQAQLGEVPAGGMPRASTDLSKMSPREIADRLFDRVMRLSSEGKADSVQLFAGMALMQYETMGGLDNDLRYDFGRVAEVAGREEIARAQADSILKQSPTHLLGLVLATKAATMRNDQKALADFNKRLVAAAPAERAKGLEEYQRHSTDIESALKQAGTPR